MATITSTRGPTEGPDGGAGWASSLECHNVATATPPRTALLPSGPTVRVARNGEIIVLRPETPPPPPPAPPAGRPWKRAKVKGDTRRSKKAFEIRLAEIDRLAHPEDSVAVLTLTYGRVHPTTHKGWAANLNAFKRLLEKRLGQGIGTLWRKQFAGREIPHYHIIALLPGGVVAGEYVKAARRAWLEVVGDGSASHRRHGTHGEKLGSWTAIRRYLTKFDRVPIDPATGTPIETGRMWGTWRADLITVAYDTFQAAPYLDDIRRVLRRYRRPKKGRQRLRGRTAAYTTMSVFMPYDRAVALLEFYGVSPP